MRCASSARISYMPTINVILSERTSRAQDYLANHAKDLDKIRGLWTAIVEQREALMGLLQTEEKTAIQLEREREKDSVVYLSQARADIEGTIPSLNLHLVGEPHNLIVIRRAASGPSNARLGQATPRQGTKSQSRLLSPGHPSGNI